jgi:hypothetical protein
MIKASGAYKINPSSLKIIHKSTSEASKRAAYTFKYPLKLTFSYIEFTLLVLPETKILSTSKNFKTSLTYMYATYFKFWLNNRGQHTAEGHFGTTNVPTALQLTKWLIYLLTKLIGGTI